MGNQWKVLWAPSGSFLYSWLKHLLPFYLNTHFLASTVYLTIYNHLFFFLSLGEIYWARRSQACVSHRPKYEGWDVGYPEMGDPRAPEITFQSQRWRFKWGALLCKVVNARTVERNKRSIQMSFRGNHLVHSSWTGSIYPRAPFWSYPDKTEIWGVQYVTQGGPHARGWLRNRVLRYMEGFANKEAAVTRKAISDQ